MHLHRQTFLRNQNRKWRKTELLLHLQLPLQKVLPVPGGPTKSLLSGFLLLPLYISVDSFKKSTTSFKIFFLLLQTCYIFKSNFLLSSMSSCTALAKIHHLGIVPPPPPPDIWRFIIIIRKMPPTTKITGNTVVRKYYLSGGTSDIIQLINF